MLNTSIKRHRASSNKHSIQRITTNYHAMYITEYIKAAPKEIKSSVFQHTDISVSICYNTHCIWRWLSNSKYHFKQL